MTFTILDRWGNYPSNAKRQVFLTWDDWNDYSFLTLYGIFYVDEKSEKHDLGGIKIGYFGQKESERKLRLGETFDELGSEFFSVGVDVEYYEKLNELGESVRDKILCGFETSQKTRTYIIKQFRKR